MPKGKEICKKAIDKKLGGVLNYDTPPSFL